MDALALLALFFFLASLAVLVRRPSPVSLAATLFGLLSTVILAILRTR